MGVHEENHLKLNEPWRIFRIIGEFVDGFDELSEVTNAVSIFGSSAATSRDPYYKLTERIAVALVRAGYAIITGAGPGIMEAANKGAVKAHGESIGLNIEIPLLQKPNRFVTRLLNFRFFFVRRVMFVKYSKAFVVMPGGYGTLDEFSEVVTLIQTKKIDPIPVILVGRTFWSGLLTWLEQDVAKSKYIEPKDLGLFTICDTPEEIVRTIEAFYGRPRSRVTPVRRVARTRGNSTMRHGSGVSAGRRRGVRVQPPRRRAARRR